MLATTESERPIVLLRDAWLLDLGRKGYREVWELQKALVDRRAEDRIPDGLILVEHDPVATLGRRGKREDVRDPGLGVFEIERGDVKASGTAHFQSVFGVTVRRVDVNELLPEPRAGRPRRP